MDLLAFRPKNCIAVDIEIPSSIPIPSTLPNAPIKLPRQMHPWANYSRPKTYVCRLLGHFNWPRRSIHSFNAFAVAVWLAQNITVTPLTVARAHQVQSSTTFKFTNGLKSRDRSRLKDHFLSSAFCHRARAFRNDSTVESLVPSILARVDFFRLFFFFLFFFRRFFFSFETVRCSGSQCGKCDDSFFGQSGGKCRMTHGLPGRRRENLEAIPCVSNGFDTGSD